MRRSDPAGNVRRVGERGGAVRKRKIARAKRSAYCGLKCPKDFQAVADDARAVYVETRAGLQARAVGDVTGVQIRDVACGKQCA